MWRRKTSTFQMENFGDIFLNFLSSREYPNTANLFRLAFRSGAGPVDICLCLCFYPSLSLLYSSLSLSLSLFITFQHISSRRHKDRAAGKPAKPKFSPYPPTPREHGLQAVSTPPSLALCGQKSCESPPPLCVCVCVCGGG